MIRMIAAVSFNGIIGKNNTLPWVGKYPEDMKYFRTSTVDSTIIYGRNTFESFGSKPLPKRRNILVSRNKELATDSLEVFESLDQAIAATEKDKDVWLIGGASLYRDGMKFAQEIHLTIIPEHVSGDNLVSFPWINPINFKLQEVKRLQSNLPVLIYSNE